MRRPTGHGTSSVRAARAIGYYMRYYLFLHCWKLWLSCEDRSARTEMRRQTSPFAPCGAHTSNLLARPSAAPRPWAVPSRDGGGACYLPLAFEALWSFFAFAGSRCDLRCAYTVYLDLSLSYRRLDSRAGSALLPTASATVVCLPVALAIACTCTTQRREI